MPSERQFSDGNESLAELMFPESKVWANHLLASHICNSEENALQQRASYKWDSQIPLHSIVRTETPSYGDTKVR